MTFFVFSILQKISTGSPILKFEFPLKICTKNVKLNMKNLSNITPNQDRLGIQHSYFFPRFEPTDFLLTAFFFDGFLGFTTRFFCFTLTFFFGFKFRLGFFIFFFSENGLVYVAYYTFCYQKVNFTSSQVS